MAKQKIVFFDMDGTLYQTTEDNIQDSALAAIQSLRDAGYKIAAATGRGLHQLKPILDHVQFDYYVLINGGYVLDQDFNEIGSYPMSHEDVDDLVSFAEDKNFGLMGIFGDSSYIYNDFYPMYYFAKYVNSLDSLWYDPTKSFHHRHPAFNMVVLTKSPDDMEMFMQEHPNLRSDLININTGAIAYDIFNAGNDKSHGIEAVLDHEGLDWNDVIAFGDSTNDIHMLDKAGIGIAMDSATDYVKSFADWTTQDTFHHGIYSAVKRILALEENE